MMAATASSSALTASLRSVELLHARRWRSPQPMAPAELRHACWASLRRFSTSQAADSGAVIASSNARLMQHCTMPPPPAATASHLSHTIADALGKWLKQWLAVPRVVIPEGTEPPTALSWLRRRGPPLPHAALQRLFRQQTVRCFDPATQKVGRVSKARLLPAGAMLLLPKVALAAAAGGGAGSAAGGGREWQGSSSEQQQQRQLASPAAKRWVAALRSDLLHVCPDFLAINKPAGLACQGGRGLAVSLDGLMGEAFGQLPGVADGRRLRLVHRLDKQTTGALLIAQNPDSAAWLAAAFKEGSLSSSIGSDGTGGSAGSRRLQQGEQAGQAGKCEAAAASTAASQPASIRKTYWAVVVRPEGEAEEAAEDGPASQAGDLSARSGSSTGSRKQANAWLPRSGAVRLPVPSSKDPSALQPAETAYRVLHWGPRLAWLELSPATGRKHQLRLHCARGLGAAILGDGLYGTLRSPGQQAALAALPADIGGGSGTGGVAAGQPPLFLHCRQLDVRRPGAASKRKQAAVAQVTAPLPPTWRALLERQGWPLPREPEPFQPA